MKASTQTLQNVVDSLPASLAMRYKKQFWVSAANEILSDIEKAGRPDIFRAEAPLLLREGVSQYRLPAEVREILGLYAVTPGCATPDTRRPIDFQHTGNQIRLHRPPTISGLDDITGTATSGSETELVSAAITAAEGDLVGRVCIITHDDDTVESRIIAANDGAGGVTFNGELSAPVAASDDFEITADFLWIRYSIYFEAFIYDSAHDDVGMGKTIPLDKAFDTAFRYGMTWKANMQSEKTSNESQSWEGNFRSELSVAITSFQALGEATPHNKPRPVCDFSS